jgi:hypothetical protein
MILSEEISVDATFLQTITDPLCKGLVFDAEADEDRIVICQGTYTKQAFQFQNRPARESLKNSRSRGNAPIRLESRT